MTRRTARPASVAITGASSGLGRALALEYAGPGVSLALFGRDPARLAETADACAARGADAIPMTIDVMDAAAMRAALTGLAAKAPLDLLIANAGVTSGRQPDGSPESAEAALRVLNVNVLGVANAVLPALDAMLARGRGQIALMGSLSARPPLPAAPAYSASKAAVETWGLALRAVCLPLGVQVNVISPGFIASAMSSRILGPKPLIMSAGQAAVLIRRGLGRNRARIAFPRALAWPAALASALPAPLAMRLTHPFAFRVAPD